MSNVGRHKDHVSESHASCVFFQAVKASESMSVCTGPAARKSNAYASFHTKAAPFRSGCPGRRRFAQASNSRFSPVRIGSAARKSNAYASFHTKAASFRSGCQDRWQFTQANNTRFLQPPREGLTSSVGAGAGAPPKANVSQSVGAAAQRKSARSTRHRVERQRDR